MNEEIDRKAEILSEALEREGEQRRVYLEAACAGDEALRSEIEALIRAESAATRMFLETAHPVSEILSMLQGRMLTGASLGPYRVEDLLGSGGSGSVYRACDMRTGQRVALKVVPAQPEVRARFVREAALARRIEHPNVARVFDNGEAEGFFYVAMELVEGETLRQRLAAPLAAGTVFGIAMQLAAALAAIHASGVVHGDLKPENLVLDSDGRLKVIDFGLARREAPPSPDSIYTAVGGTIGYLAPEQVRGEPAGLPADIFAFGAILYELLARRQAFGGATGLEIASAILRDEPSTLPEATPAAAAALVSRCLSKKSSRRPAAEMLVAQLPRIAAGGRSVGQQRRRKRVLGAVAGLSMLASAAWFASLPGPGQRLFLHPVEAVLPSSALDPAYSWDGRMVAYSAVAGAPPLRKIFVATPDFDTPRQVTFGPFEENEPSLSPDGTLVAFHSTRSPEGVYAAALQGEPRLVGASGRAPRFSPDGRWIGYEVGQGLLPADPSRRTTSAVFRVAAGGGTPQAVCPRLGAVASPIWSEDSQELLVLRRVTEHSELWACPLSGPMRLVIGQMPLPARLLATGGGTVLFAAHGAVHKVALDGRPVWSSARSDEIASLTRDQAGRMLVAEVRQRAELWSLALAGGTIAPLVRSQSVDYGYPFLSRDGRQLLYRSVTPSQGWHELLRMGGETAGRPVPLAGGMTPGGKVVPPRPQGMIWDALDEGLTIGASSGNGLWRIAAGEVPILSHPRLHLYLASVSPDRRWIAFTGEAEGLRTRIFVAPFRGAQPVGTEEWIASIPGDSPRWGYDGFLYSYEDAKLVRRRWHEAGKAFDAPQALVQFGHETPSPQLLPPGWFRLALSSDRIVFPLGTRTSRLYEALEITSNPASRFSPKSLISTAGGIFLRKTLILLGLVTGAMHATVYDLKSDFSNSSNPNGVWSFAKGTTAMTHFNLPGGCCVDNLDAAVANGIWSANAPTPTNIQDSTVFQTTANGAATGLYTNNDWLSGDVVAHSTNPGNGVDVFIRWTAPTAGTISYNGGVWYAHSFLTTPRSGDFFVNLNGGANLHSGTVSSAQNRSNALTFADAGPVNVAAGDVLAIRLARTTGQQFGTLMGVNFTVNFDPASSNVPEPAASALVAGGLLLAALRLRRG
ncbi:MAG: protein kinase [Bryobacteraceae bacterium]